MSTRLVIDNANQLRELGDQPQGIRIMARIISYLFHPVFVPVYVLLFLVYVHPAVFAGASSWDKMKLLFQGVLMFTFFPIITILLLKAVGFIQSIFLSTQRDRIIPYIACMIWYFWIAYVWNNLPDTPLEAKIFAAAVFIASIIGQMANIYFRISMHSLAMGVAVCFLVILGFIQQANMGMYISIGVLVAGLVCSSRLIVSDHSTKEIYWGFVGGVAAQLVAYLVKGLAY
jgi:hypothetical protein